MRNLGLKTEILKSSGGDSNVIPNVGGRRQKSAPPKNGRFRIPDFVDSLFFLFKGLL